MLPFSSYRWPLGASLAFLIAWIGCSSLFFPQADALVTDRQLAPSGTFVNPILQGSYADPSIIRVGEDFYMVSSSFEYFPGIPIHHSKDMVNWRLIGYALNREDQVSGAVNLVDVKQDDGIQAATIRYNKGKFYIVVTTVYRGMGVADGTCTSFIMDSDSAAGPWSEPHILEGADGIDPSLFFDSDEDGGKAWYVATHAPAKPDFTGQGQIYLWELDLETWAFKGDRIELWRGACNGVWVEGPHIYKHNGWYYLIVAEGGTGFHHAVMVAASKAIEGPYVSSPRNPIITARHLSHKHWLQRVGHADFVELADGRWYAAVLGVRNQVNYTSNMGRESYLVPIIWEREVEEWEAEYTWPVLADPMAGTVQRVVELPFAEKRWVPERRYFDDFAAHRLGLEWNFRRLPTEGTYSLAARSGFLRLYAKPAVISEPDRSRCSLMGVRQKEATFSFKAFMQFDTKLVGAEAGVMLFQKDDVYLQFTIKRSDNSWLLQLLRKEKHSDAREVTSRELPDYNKELRFEVHADLNGYNFSYALARDGPVESLFQGLPPDALLMAGYTGAYMGLYATTVGQTSHEAEYADFDWVERTTVITL